MPGNERITMNQNSVGHSLDLAQVNVRYNAQVGVA